MPMKILILSGPVQSGKTTALQQWCINRNAGGYLTPIQENRRMVQGLSPKISIPFEVPEPAEDTISVGRYHLLRSAFIQMNELLKAASATSFSWVVVDEVGPLELQHEGVHEGFSHLLNQGASNVLVVVRSHLVSRVVDKYSLAQATVIEKEMLSRYSEGIG